MKVAVMGAGALGGYFGGRLLESGIDVAFIARGAHLDAIRDHGLRVRSPAGDMHLKGIKASDDPADIGPVDWILFLVKLYDTERAATLLAPMLGADTAVLSLQNGIDPWSRIGSIVGDGRVLGGAAVIPAELEAPGVIRHDSDFARITFGEFDGARTSRAQMIADQFTAAGIDVTLTEMLEVELWKKFIMLSAFSCLSALTRLSIGGILADEYSTGMLERLMRESFAVAKAEEPRLPDDMVERHMDFFRHGSPPGMRASMLNDIEQGKPLETDHVSGAIMRLGTKHGIPTPAHELAWSILHPHFSGHR